MTLAVDRTLPRTRAGAPAPRPATCPIYAGVFLTTLATLAFEIALTRIFSVTMWYHYAFVAISVALFGMTAGAIIVYLLPHRFPQDGARRQMAAAGLGLAATIVLSVLAHLALPAILPPGSLTPLLLGTYIVVSVPFVWSGIGIALALSRFPGQVPGLYAADLAGAACGCLLLIPALDAAGGPATVLLAAGIAALGGAAFAVEAGRGWQRGAIALAAALVLAAGGNAVLAQRGTPVLRVRWVKGRVEPPPLYEKWNSFSRIAVSGDPHTAQDPMGWGLSARTPRDAKVRQLDLTIDAAALTVMTAFNGDRRPLRYLAYDLTNFAHYLRRNADVLVVGPGGGRDVLAALVFGQRSVTAVEINRDILKTVNDVFGPFTGHLDRRAGVRFVNDEARSYIARTPSRFDIIQVSLVDTAAATAAGAYVLTENALYTTDAWRTMLDHLTPTGILTVTRWALGDNPAEIFRLTALARAALQQAGISDPRAHIAVVRRLVGVHPVYGPAGMATILVARAPFSPADLATIDVVAGRLGFDRLLTPQRASAPLFARLAGDGPMDEAVRASRFNIAPPTDNTPFFFNMVRVRDAFLPGRTWGRAEAASVEPVRMLGVLLLAVAALTAGCVLLPLWFGTRPERLRDRGSPLLFFAAIGLGFMMVEISQMQRLIIFLGHPTYALSVVLFSLLLSSGLGSLLVTRLRAAEIRMSGLRRLAALLGLLVLFGLLTPPALAALRGAATPLRAAAAVGILAPVGVFMGMAFPLGMMAAAAGAEAPWFWAVNGATSVCGSVVSVIIAMSAGIAAAFWTGVACYAAAWAAFARFSRTRRVSAVPAFPATHAPRTAARVASGAAGE